MAANKHSGIVCPICGGEMGVASTRAGFNYLRRRRVCNDYRCSGRLTTIEIAHNGSGFAKVSRHGVVILPKPDVEAMHAILGLALHRRAEDDADEDDSDEAVSPSK